MKKHIDSMNKYKMLQKFFMYIVILVLILPSLVLTWYSYPCQDDFAYAYHGGVMMEQGYNLFTMSVAKVVEWYGTFVGAYTSTFLGYFFSGIINCNIWGIRIFEFCSALIFYVALYCFVYSFFCLIMGFAKEKTLICYCLVLLFFQGLIGYSDHDDFYWFITSVQYLLISSFILLGVSSLVYAIYEIKTGKKTLFLVISAVLGFLGSGGTLSIAAFCCALYLLAAAWGCVRKQTVAASVGMGAAFVGAVINGIAPGNYVRDGQEMSVGRLARAVIQSFRYTLERWELIVKNPIFWMVFLCFILFLLTCTRTIDDFAFPCPIIFVGFLFCLIAGIIFPTMLGYGYDTYLILNRGNFISDMSFYLFLFLALLYGRGWFEKKYHVKGIAWNKDATILFGMVMVFFLITDRHALDNVPIVKEYRDWVHGNYREYAEFCVGIYEEIAESEEDIVEVHRKLVEDTTYMMNPQFYVGTYDPEVEYANTAIARFYGKTAIWLFIEE